MLKQAENWELENFNSSTNKYSLNSTNKILIGTIYALWTLQVAQTFTILHFCHGIIFVHIYIEFCIFTIYMFHMWSNIDATWQKNFKANAKHSDISLSAVNSIGSFIVHSHSTLILSFYLSIPTFILFFPLFTNLCHILFYFF